MGPCVDVASPTSRCQGHCTHRYAVIIAESTSDKENSLSTKMLFFLENETYGPHDPPAYDDVVQENSNWSCCIF